MSGGIRLAAFGGLLAVAFGGALAVGDVVGPDRGDQRHEGDHPPSLRLTLLTTEFPRYRERTLRFRVLDGDGRAVRSFRVEQTKRMHVILVDRFCVSDFQHVHPVLGADGTWSTPLRFRGAGIYRVFADFDAGTGRQTLAGDVEVEGEGSCIEPSPAPTADAGDGYIVSIEGSAARAGSESDLTFAVRRRRDAAVSTEPYLGAGGHLVALRTSNLRYLHTHPTAEGDMAGDQGQAHGDAMEERSGGDGVTFTTTFPTAGRHRLFFQFKHAGTVRVAAFTVDVAR